MGDRGRRHRARRRHVEGSPLSSVLGAGLGGRRVVRRATALEVALTVALLSGRQRRWVGKVAAGLFVVYLVAMGLSSVRGDVVFYAMPVLVGGALVLSATPAHLESTPQSRGSQPNVTNAASLLS